eukprot:g1501.t1
MLAEILLMKSGLRKVDVTGMGQLSYDRSAFQDNHPALAEAETILRRAIQCDPRDLESAGKLFDVLQLKRGPSGKIEAEKMLCEALQWLPETHGTGRRAYKDFVSALGNLAQSMSAFEDIGKPHYRPDVAIILYRRALEIDPQHINSRLELSRLWSMTTQTVERAKDLCEKTAAEFPTIKKVQMFYARYLAGFSPDRCKFEQVVNHLSTLSMTPSEIAELADITSAQEHRVQQEAHLRAALDSNPCDSRLLNSLSDMLRFQPGCLPDAIRFARRACDVSPHDGQCLFKYCTLLKNEFGALAEAHAVSSSLALSLPEPMCGHVRGLTRRLEIMINNEPIIDAVSDCTGHHGLRYLTPREAGQDLSSMTHIDNLLWVCNACLRPLSAPDASTRLQNARQWRLDRRETGLSVVVTANSDNVKAIQALVDEGFDQEHAVQIIDCLMHAQGAAQGCLTLLVDLRNLADRLRITVARESSAQLDQQEADELAQVLALSMRESGQQSEMAEEDRQEADELAQALALSMRESGQQTEVAEEDQQEADELAQALALSMRESGQQIEVAEEDQQEAEELAQAIAMSLSGSSSSLPLAPAPVGAVVTPANDNDGIERFSSYVDSFEERAEYLPSLEQLHSALGAQEATIHEHFLQALSIDRGRQRVQQHKDYKQWVELQRQWDTKSVYQCRQCDNVYVAGATACDKCGDPSPPESISALELVVQRVITKQMDSTKAPIAAAVGTPLFERIVREKVRGHLGIVRSVVRSLRD